MKVVEFVKRVNKDDVKITPDEILEGAAGLLETVIVIGKEPNNDIYLSTNIEDKRDLVYMLEMLKFDILAGEFDHE